MQKVLHIPVSTHFKTFQDGMQMMLPNKQLQQQLLLLGTIWAVPNSKDKWMLKTSENSC